MKYLSFRHDEYQDEELSDEELSDEDEEYFSSNEYMEPDTTEIKPSSPKTFFHRHEGQASPLARERAADGKMDIPPRRRLPVIEEDDEFLESDDEDEEGESSTQDGWLGNGDQTADLVLLLRWARSYRVSVQVAGRMLNMKPEIVNRAVMVRAQSTDPNAKEDVVVEAGY